MKIPPPAEWWLESYVQVAKELGGDKRYRPRGGKYEDYEGPLWRFVAENVTEALADHCSTLEACNRWYSGAFLLETVPSIIYILMQYGHDPEEAMIRAMNDTKDNDTIAAIIGATVGALHGRSNLPSRWIKDLTGRTTDQNDGRMFDLLREARKKYTPE